MLKQHKVDLILIIKMPGINGLEASKIIKELNKDIPIIAQTAFTEKYDKTFSNNYRCDAYIPKPIKEPHLLDLINDFLSL